MLLCPIACRSSPGAQDASFQAHLWQPLQEISCLHNCSEKKHHPCGLHREPVRLVVWHRGDRRVDDENEKHDNQQLATSEKCLHWPSTRKIPTIAFIMVTASSQ